MCQHFLSWICIYVYSLCYVIQFFFFQILRIKFILKPNYIYICVKGNNYRIANTNTIHVLRKYKIKLRRSFCICIHTYLHAVKNKIHILAKVHNTILHTWKIYTYIYIYKVILCISSFFFKETCTFVEMRARLY